MESLNVRTFVISFRDTSGTHTHLFVCDKCLWSGSCIQEFYPGDTDFIRVHRLFAYDTAVHLTVTSKVDSQRQALVAYKKEPPPLHSIHSIYRV